MKYNELKLCCDIYDLNMINYAVESYKKIADISVEKMKRYYVCKFNNCVYDISQTMKEFENFVIQASNSKEIDK